MKINLLKMKVEENMEKDQINHLEVEVEEVALEDNLMVEREGLEETDKEEKVKSKNKSKNRDNKNKKSKKYN